MKIVRWFLPVILLLTLFLSACGGKVIETALGKEFTMALRETGKITAEDLSIKLIGVSNDSRCPEGVTCIWAGTVSCLLEITLDGIKENYTLVVPGAGDNAGQVYGAYVFYAKVTPYPRQGIEITETDYRLLLTVEKNG